MTMTESRIPEDERCDITPRGGAVSDKRKIEIVVLDPDEDAADRLAWLTLRHQRLLDLLQRRHDEWHVGPSWCCPDDICREAFREEVEQ